MRLECRTANNHKVLQKTLHYLPVRKFRDFSAWRVLNGNQSLAILLQKQFRNCCLIQVLEELAAMPFQRIISALLLVAFGLPAAVGSFWHTHHHGPSHGIAHQQEHVEHHVHQVSCLSSTRFEQESATCCDHDSHSHDSVEVDSCESKSDSTPLSHDDCGTESESCSICKFYGELNLLPVAIELSADSEFSTWMTSLGTVEEVVYSIASSARGPPLC